jgi:hypothetical protein
MDMKPKVYVTRRLPQEGMDMLEGGCEVGFNPHDRGMTREELMACVKDADGLVTLLSDSIDAEVMDAGPKLKVIANYAVGFNNINIAAATERGIAVTNTPGVLTETTADLAWALLMATARRIVESDRFMRSGRFQGWAPMLYLGHDIYDKTLGVVGFGRIGQAVAHGSGCSQLKQSQSKSCYVVIGRRNASLQGVPPQGHRETPLRNIFQDYVVSLLHCSPSYSKVTPRNNCSGVHKRVT